MSQIEELQSRITAAMDRISAGVETVSASGGAVRDTASDMAYEAALEAAQKAVAALEEEKLANAQLQERLKSIRTRHQEELDALRGDLDRSQEIEALKSEIASLRADLEDSSAAEVLQGELDQQRSEMDTQAGAMGRLDMDVQRVRQSNDQLREANAALREANEAGVGEPHLINKAMLAELEGLRATRATDVAEASAVLARLEPLLANATHLQEGEGE